MSDNIFINGTKLLEDEIQQYIQHCVAEGYTNGVKDLKKIIREAVEDNKHYHTVCKHTCDLFLDDLEGQSNNPVNNLVKLRYEEIAQGLQPDEC